MGVFILILTILIFSWGGCTVFIKDKDIAADGLVVGVLIDIVVILFSSGIKDHITYREYNDACNAKILLTEINEITSDNIETIAYNMNVIKHYMEKRRIYEKKIGNWWNGYFYNEKELYPTVDIDFKNFNFIKK